MKKQGLANGLSRGTDAHEFLLERQPTGLHLDSPIPSGDKPSQLLGAGRQRCILKVIATRGIGKNLLASAAEQLVERHISGLAFDIPQGDVDAAERGHNLCPLATRQGRWQTILSPHPPWSRGG